MFRNYLVVIYFYVELWIGLVLERDWSDRGSDKNKKNCDCGIFIFLKLEIFFDSWFFLNFWIFQFIILKS